MEKHCAFPALLVDTRNWPTRFRHARLGILSYKSWTPFNTIEGHLSRHSQDDIFIGNYVELLLLSPSQSVSGVHGMFQLVLQGCTSP